MAITVNSNGHTITAKTNIVERVFYDGREMSKKVTMFGGTHIFTVQEDGENVQYEVKMGVAWWGGHKVQVRRNGLVIFDS